MARQIRTRTGTEGRWSPRAEALLFAAARSDHVDRTIRPALARGQWVLSDRFLDSSLAYQGGAENMRGSDWLRKVKFSLWIGYDF